MTLLDLWKLIKPKALIILVISIVCMLICLAGTTFLVKASYSAKSTIAASGQTAVLGSIATQNASDASTDGVSVAVTTNSSAGTVIVTATGSDSDTCVSVANKVAEESTSQFTSQIPAATTSTIKTTAATSATPSKFKYPLMVFIACIFICIIFLVVKDLVKGSVHGWQDIERKYKVAYLGSLGGSDASKERLLAGVCLAGREGKAAAQSACLIPIGATTACKAAVQQLASTPAVAPFETRATESLNEGAAAIYAAREAESTVLVVEAEVSTFKDLDIAVRALDVASVKPVGFIFVKKSKHPKH